MRDLKVEYSDMFSLLFVFSLDPKKKIYYDLIACSIA